MNIHNPASVRKPVPMQTHTMPERRACCPSPAPSKLPTRIVDAVATPKGKLMNRKTQSVSIAVCASSSTVPRAPAKAVVTSKEEASAAIMAPPGSPSFQNCCMVCSLQPWAIAFQRVGPFPLADTGASSSGSVTDRQLVPQHATYARSMRNMMMRVAENAAAAPSNPKRLMSTKFTGTFTTAESPVITAGGHILHCACKAFMMTRLQMKGSRPGIIHLQ
mmetsp:Transcript_7620/g.22495  ORF Transcript_7620/g.22495 Transcript_7620/m.22495 type:complete len:219 (-) Transcript_7620:1800-2456(-)